MMYRHSRLIGLLSASLVLSESGSMAFADDMVQFATGGYARGLRTEAIMHRIDTNGDGKISREEWIAYQERVWRALDKSRTGKVDEKQFLTPSVEITSFATGGYARGLQTSEMMHKIDIDGDGTVSHDEFISYQVSVFDMMDVQKAGNIGPREFLDRGSLQSR